MKPAVHTNPKVETPITVPSTLRCYTITVPYKVTTKTEFEVRILCYPPEVKFDTTPTPKESLKTQ